MTAVTPDQPSVVPAGEPSPDAVVPTPHPAAAPSSPAAAGTPGIPGAFAGSQPDPRYVDHREQVGFARAPFAGRTWREYGYLSLALLLAPFAFSYGLFSVVFLVAMIVPVLGLVVAGWVVVGGRGWGSMYRSLARSLLGVDVAAPAPYTRRRGFWSTLWSGIGDGTGWRAVLFLVVTFPLAILSFVVSTVFLAVGLGGMTHWIWSRWLPLQQAADGSWHRGAQFGVDWYVDTPARQLGLVLVGALFLWVWPHVTRAFAHLFRVLTVALLGPTLSSLRVADLEESRGRTVEDADAKLRRIERDLHDGTQARLVAVAMQLGEAKEQLAAGGDAGDALRARRPRALVDQGGARRAARARARHPPARARQRPRRRARDPRGALAPAGDGRRRPGRRGVRPARSRGRVHRVLLRRQSSSPTPSSTRATGVYVLVERQGSGRGARLRLRVRDDGQGGARVVQPGSDGHRSGLAGLAERVRSVDGSFELTSPVGGPTVVTVLLPVRV